MKVSVAVAVYYNYETEIPDDTARDQGIAGEKTFGSTVAADKRYWNCGNKSNYIYFNLAIILMFLFLL